MTIPAHPFAGLFPLIEGPQFDELVEDIKKNGLLEPVWLHPDGRILDGRNRYRACLEAGVEPIFETPDCDSHLSFVLSKNLYRRHLTKEQRGKAAVESLPFYEAEAAERRKRKSVPTIVSEQKAKGEAREFAAKAFGVGTTYISAIKKVKAEYPYLYEQLGKKTLPEIKRELQLEARAAVVEQIKAEPAPLPTGPFRTIVIDPPWAYECDARAADPSHRSGHHYPTMTLDQIKALPVADCAHDDCILWLWTTNSFMHEAFHCLEAWGFKHKTILTWDKVHFGLGDTLRNVTEHCLVAVKGHPILADAHRDTSTIIRETRRAEHSRKPEAFYALVDAVCPGRNKLEMFAREQRSNWESWGAETERFR
jgi:N6-adenosine-specific RNA methylase IME4